MTIAGKVTAMLGSLTHEQLAALTSIQPQRLSDEPERVNFLIGDVERAAAKARKPKAGVLAALSDGERTP
jgi:hypothetical protein